MLPAFLAGLCALGLKLVYKHRSYDDDPAESFAVVACMLAIIGAITCVALGISLPISNLGDANNLQTFYDVNASNYATTIQDTQNILTIDSNLVTQSLIEGSVEKTNVGASLSTRIAEYRDAVNEYNAGLRRMRSYDHNTTLGILYPTLPDYLKPIVIK